MSKKKKRRAARPVVVRPTVTFRSISIDFAMRKVSIDGAVYSIESPVLHIPILSGDAVFLPSAGQERVA